MTGRTGRRSRHAADAALLAATLVAAAATWVASPLGATAADAAERCDGVWVVVDAADLGGAVTTRCAQGDPATGFEALRMVGHTWTDHPRFPGMVCTIDGRPDPCNGAPPEAHWSYWTAEGGGTWAYSTRGAGSRDPAPGSVEGWAFGAGDPPSVAPPNPPPPPEPSPTPTPTETAGAASSPEPPATRPETTATADPADPAPSDGDGEEPGRGTDPGPEGDGAAPPDGDGSDGGSDGGDVATDVRPAPTAPSPPATPQDERQATAGADARAPVELRTPEDEVAVRGPSDGGGTAGLVAGGTLAAAIAGAGAFQARRRRRRFDA